MGFKSDEQRKGFFAQLGKGKNRLNTNPKSESELKAAQEKFKNLSYNQLLKKGVKLKPHGDADKDGVVNIKDCKPLNKKEQGVIHRLFKKHAVRVGNKVKLKKKSFIKDLRNSKLSKKVKLFIEKHPKTSAGIFAATLFTAPVTSLAIGGAAGGAGLITLGTVAIGPYAAAGFKKFVKAN